MNGVINHIQEVGNWFKLVGKDVDTMNKFVKVLIPGMELAESIIKCTPVGTAGITGLTLLKGKFKVLKSVVTATNIFVRGKGWLKKDERDKILESWKKITGQISLTVGQTLELGGFLHACEAINLGKIATFAIGKVPVFHLAKSTCYGVAAFTGIAEDVPKANKSRKAMNGLNKDLKKWEHYAYELQNPQKIDPSRLVKRFEKKISIEGRKKDTNKRAGKIAEWKQYLKVLKGNDSDKIGIFQRLRAGKIRDHMPAQHSDRKTSDWAQYKVKELKFALSGEKRNFTKSFLSTATNVGKIVMLAIGIIVLATCASSLAASLAVSGLGILANSFQFVKVVYVDHTKRIELVKPEFN